MGAVVHPSLVSQVVRHLPAPLLNLLDAWSSALARRRWQQRQLKWQQRKAATVAAAPAASYHLKPWRD
ncbi:hypothetical protein [Ramlibacter montanisoli]|jgi:hypothetical protein|uniref:Uncharacterized protein n=1 Tax=Ramlibacter montanisoli TaxID=2732512 RepID=A0A849KIM0_9BURK|nr:hypothetical protein [Ramlibacter montanisoli]NNU44685.1 hypothetical protein [Ramlibacter montanisoli]